MKKYLLFLVITVFCWGNCFGQAGEWTWMHGSNTSNSSGNFGTQGVPSPANDPPALYEACEWSDLNGNFWLFGGAYPSNNYCALWKYDPLLNEWTWINGLTTTNDVGNYGVQGISSPTNRPPARGWGTASWVDLNGNFWMFGGQNQLGRYNDLWKYNIAINEWVWMKGPNTPNQPGVYGVQGIPSILNNPGYRWETAAAWTDNAGDLWLFGGGAYNDLCRYNISTNEWTWMKGDNTSSGQPSIYGTIEIEATANTPSGRMIYGRWKDNLGNLWLHGGYEASQGNLKNDLWRYNPATNNWTWMNGNNTANPPGSYGTRCVLSQTNTPCARYENRACWEDTQGNFWMFGGRTDTAGLVLWARNDLWMYCVYTNEWKWISGDTINNPSGNWGTLGLSSPSNKPDGRFGSVAWNDSSGHLYLFGGAPQTWPSVNNDLWRFTIDTSCNACSSLPLSAFSTSTSICPGTCTSFLNLSTNATTYQWSFLSATPPTSTDVNPTNICYPIPGSYDVQLIASNSNGSDTLLLANYITVYPTPAPQSITQSGDTLFAIAGAASYQWYFNTNLINGATDYFYVAQASGDYNVVATDANGCEVEAAVFNVVAVIPSTVDSGLLTIFPNPVEDKVKIQIPIAIGIEVKSETAIEISVYNLLGEMVLTVQPHIPGFIPITIGTETSIDVSELTSGLYYIEIVEGEKVLRSKFVKQ